MIAPKNLAVTPNTKSRNLVRHFQALHFHVLHFSHPGISMVRHLHAVRLGPSFPGRGFSVNRALCCVHLRSLATRTPNSLNVVTRSTRVPLRVTDSGGSLRTGPNSMSFVLRSLCSIVTWWGGPGGIEAWSLERLLPSVLWHCWLGRLTRKTHPRYDLWCV